MNDYRLSDLFDLTVAQKMADAHYRAAGMPMGIIDAVDGSILVGSGWQDICAKFHRTNPLSLKRCQESDDYVKGHLVEGEACHYRCQNGLWDIGIPIMVAGRHLATLFLGQFFYEGETQDREFFIQLAHEFGFDIHDYLAALDRVPVFSREKVDYILEYDKALVSFIADLAKHALSKIKADEMIRENERKFRAIFDQTYEFIGLLDTDGTIIEANKTALRFAGVQEADIIGKPFWTTPWWAHSPDLQKKVRDGIERAAKGEFIRFEAAHYSADGILHYVDFSLKPVSDETGKVVLLIPESRDITDRRKAERALQEAHDELEVRVRERTAELQTAYTRLETEMTEKKQIEEQLRQAQKMEAIGTLAGGIAHDFNNILAAILGFAELALDDVARGSQLETKLRHILISSIRGRDLVKQILTFSRKLQYERKPLSLIPITRETIKLLRASLPASVRIQFNEEVTCDTVLADPGEIQQIVMNLCTNAAYAMRETGGTLHLCIDNVEIAPGTGVGALSPGLYVRLIVKDTGTGMDQKTIKRIFEPFFTTKPVGEGTGMGLAVVYGIVKSLNGDITVASAPGIGATFHVLLPKAQPAFVSEGLPAPEDQKGQGNILFIDDEELLAELGQDMLERLGYSVAALTDSDEALKLFSLNPSRFDLVITDQTMPHLTGLALARKILAIRDIPIILCTGHSDAVSHGTVAAAGIREFLMKPLIRHELAEAVRRVLDAKTEASRD
ncbi:MAG: PocR ligand-binding domain-containing protein [Syntrophorhabdaceae bacterium]